jgi:hypothetical protein
MYNHSAVLVAAGTLCLLVLAWCLAGVRASTFMSRLCRSPLVRGAGRASGSAMRWTR